MTVTLGAITLDDNLSLAGIEEAPDIAVSARRTILGRMLVLTAPIAGGRALTLASGVDGNRVTGPLTLSQITQIKALAAAGNPVTLVHHRGTFTVLVVSIDPPEPVVDYADPASGDYYAAKINLIEV